MADPKPFVVPGVIELMSDATPLTAETLSAHGLRGLQCGCGQNLAPGWLNTDHVRIADRAGTTSLPRRLTRIDGVKYYLEHNHVEPLPIADGALEWAFSEHFIEHITLEESLRWFREMRRILKQGGVLRVSTPDLRRYVAGYMNPTDGFFERHRKELLGMGMKNVPARPAWMLNQIFQNWGHRWIYDFDEIRTIATAAGFARDAVVERSYRQGEVPQMAQLDLKCRSDESLYVEIRRT